jgi:arylsulfatase A-like enzyme
MGAAHGLFLLLYLLLLHAEKAVLLRPSLSGANPLPPVLVEIGFVLALEGILLLFDAVGGVGRHSRWRRRTWLALFAAAHAVVYGVVLVEHVFFLNTGTRLDLDVLRYGVTKFTMVYDLLSGGLDYRFFYRMAVALICFGLAWAVVLHRPRRHAARANETTAAPPGAAPPSPWLVASVLVGGAALLSTPLWLPGLRQPVTNNAVALWVLSGFAAEPPEVASLAARHIIAPGELYREPQITSEPGRRPNIVFIVLESTRASVVAPWAPESDLESTRASVVEPWASESGWSRTPTMAALAERAIVFEHAYSTVTHTSKALIAMLCGMYPRLAIGVPETLEHNQPLRCLPHILQELGYRSAFLQTALGAFENFAGLIRNTGFGMAAFHETLKRSGFEELGYLGLDDMAMVEPAVRWARGGGPEPFFLTLVTVTPHHPYHVPGRPMPSYSSHSVELYLDAIAYQDRFLGVFMDELERAGLLENTVVFVLGDHGEGFGEHSRKEHDAVVWQEGIHIPLLIFGPKWIGEPGPRGGLRSQIDLLPTALEILEVEWDGVLPGQSLLTGDGHEKVLSSCWYTDYCVATRSGSYKLVYHFGRWPIELYDLSADPSERHNLSGPAATDEHRRVERELLSFVMSYKASVDLFYRQHPERDGPENWWKDSILLKQR